MISESRPRGPLSSALVSALGPPTGSPLRGAPLTLALSALTALTALAIDMSLPALPQLQQTFRTDVAHVQLTLSLFLMGYGIGQFVCGSLSDHYGRRPVLLAGLALFVVSSFLCVWAPSLPVLVGLRLLQGLGASVGPILGRAMVRDLFERRESARVLSQITQVMVLAPILAPIAGGYLLIFFGWPAIFAVLGLCGTLLTALCWRRLPETLAASPARPASGHGDGDGLVRQLGRNYRFVLTHRASLLYVLSTSFSFAGLFAYVSGSPFVLMEVFGISQQHFGYYFALPALSLMAGATANRALLRRLDGQTILRLGAWLLLVAGLLAAALSWTAIGGVAGLIGPLMLYLFGLGLFGPNATAAALAHHEKTAGAASSLMGGLQTVAGGVAGFLVGAFYDQTSWSLAATLAACSVLAFASGLVRDQSPDQRSKRPEASG